MDNRLTGVSVPLGALYSEKHPCIGEYPSLSEFALFCKKSGLKIIQLLPLNDTGTQSSPYSGLSAFALHPIYISLADIAEFEQTYNENENFKKKYDGFISQYGFKNRYDYDGILNTKISLLQEIFYNTKTYKDGKADENLAKWIKSNQWVKTYAVYKNLKWNYMQASWKTWLENDRQKTPEQILELWNTKAFLKEHLFYAWCQFIAEKQFTDAVKTVHENGILLKGDMPILMNEDSCDAWANPEFFIQKLRAGSPSDGENPQGQSWGFPIYNWKELKEDNYSWWVNRLKCASKFYDAYRLDHILGFFRIWAVPEDDVNALNGHTEPYAAIKKNALYEAGFDDDRIRWLSQSHIPTSVIEDITWNHEAAHSILKLFCDKLEGEELWLFKKNIHGSTQIAQTSLKQFCTAEAEEKIKQVLISYWSNRTLLEVSKNKFVPIWTYGQSVSWNSLNEKEKKLLQDMFSALDKKNESLWKKQANEIFSAVTDSIKMTACGEDLGVGIKCVPETMLNHKILGLRVVRWSRFWDKEKQPYVPFKDYTPLSVVTTSVHDSSTIREWWDESLCKEGGLTVFEDKTDGTSDKGNGAKNNGDADKNAFTEENGTSNSETGDFSPEIAFELLKKCSESASVWYIVPLQDFLYLNKKYWLSDSKDERINVPGTVNGFNWTYRMPVSIEELCADSELTSQINKIAER